MNFDVMYCPSCGSSMKFVEPEYASFTSARAERGQHIGNVHYCRSCNQHFLDNFLSDCVHMFNYD